MRIISLLLIASCAIAPGASASDVVWVSDSGRTGMSFLSLAPSAATAALGCGGVASSSGGSSTLWSNPSLIALKTSRSASFTHTLWIEDTTTDYATFSTPFTYGAFGVAAQLFDSGDIDGRDDFGASTGDYSITNAALSFSWGYRLPGGIAVGVTGRKLFQKISDETAGGSAFDAGISWITPLSGLTLGAATRNHGRMSKLRSERTQLPSDTMIGAHYEWLPGKLPIACAVVLDAVIPRYGDTGVRSGFELRTMNRLTLRTGYRNDSDIETILFGIGVSWARMNADLTYSPFNELSGEALRLTLSSADF